jgi:hypothetical protein
MTRSCGHELRFQSMVLQSMCALRCLDSRLWHANAKATNRAYDRRRWSCMMMTTQPFCPPLDKGMPVLFVYLSPRMAWDAPRHQYGSTTLCICKPAIRRTAVGDVAADSVSKELAATVIEPCKSTKALHCWDGRVQG